MENNKSKELKLIISDGTVWGLSATESIQGWLDELAQIMKLRISDDIKSTRKILFIARNTNDLPDSINEDWNTYKQGTVYRIWYKDEIPEFFVELNTNFIDHPEIRYINMWSTLKAIFRYYVDRSGGPLHCACAELDKKLILIAAGGGTGKSTCISRLPSYWSPLSDDNALVVKDPDNNYRVHPMPTWSDHLWKVRDSSVDASYSCPLHSIFFLIQSHRDKVNLLNSAQATLLIHTSFSQVWGAFFSKLKKQEKSEMSQKLFESASNIANKIPCYQLEATLTGRFWEKIEEVI